MKSLCLDEQASGGRSVGRVERERERESVSECVPRLSHLDTILFLSTLPRLSHLDTILSLSTIPTLSIMILQTAHDLTLTCHVHRHGDALRIIMSVHMTAHELHSARDMTAHEIRCAPDITAHS